MSKVSDARFAFDKAGFFNVNGSRRLDRPFTVEERIARGAIHDFGPSLTEQHHKDSCDINVIMAGYEKTGQVPVYTDMVPSYGDFSEVTDYHGALNLVIAAQDAFDSLSASVRKEFDYDPQKFLQAVDDPAQRERLVKLGVISEKKVSDTPSDKPVEVGLPPEGGHQA